MTTTRNEQTWQSALPDVNSTITLNGLEKPVRIWRDGHGIPHVKAETLHDAFFGQGFVHAQDRLFQMDWDRRRAYGRTAELTGAPGLVNDIFARRAMLGDSAQADYEHFNAETKAMLDGYAAGVNAFINSTPSLPIEFTLAGITPEPWEPWDGCAIYKIRHILMGSGMGKLWKARFLLAFGPEQAARLRSEGQGDQVLVVPVEGEHISAMHNMDEFAAGTEALAKLFDMDAGSNNWAVHGSRTASGKPLMAGDPHRALDVPNVYYQNHVSCPDFDVVGMSFTGVPGFPHFGHNDQVAWCITHAVADYQDLYVEKFDRENPARYEYRGEMHDAVTRTEQIAVKGGDPVDVNITLTRNGPVVIGDPSTGYAISMRYTATAEPNECFHALLPMLKTRTVAEFDEAMRPWVDPCNNLIVIDTEGTIGYLTRGKVPVRDRSNAWLPVPGWTGDHDWQGMVPFEEMPRLRDPEQGYIVTANNRIVGDDFPHYIGLDYAPPGRARRIIARLRELDSATVDDMQSVHADRESLISSFFVDLISAVQTDDEAEREAIDRLKTWDNQMDLDSVGAAIYTAVRDAIVREVIEQPPMEPLRSSPFTGEPAGLSLGGVLWWQIPGMIRDEDTTVLGSGVTWQDVIAQALTQGVERLTEMLGPDINGWTWGAIHRTAPVHPLTAMYPEHQEMLNPPSVSIGGDADTPQAAAIWPASNFNVAGTSVARYIFDASDWNNSRWIVPLGASGHPASPHWADQAEQWSIVESIPMLYDWSRIEAEAESSQTLEPEGS